MRQATLLIDCPDEKGLVYKITEVLYKRELNIISNAEFVDKSNNYFFMRTEFSGDFEKDSIIRELTEILPKTAKIKLPGNEKKRLVILATKEHHCLSDLLMRHYFNELQGNILAVISNHNVLEDLTNKFGIPFYHISHENKSKEAHEEAVLAAIEQYKPEYLVLAKYMRILSPAFISKYENKIINIHHSFLPAFKGASPYRQAFDRGVKIIGATAHFVNNELDEGPIIAQSVIPVAHTHSSIEMAREGADIEKLVLAKSLKLVLEDRVFVNGNKSVIFD